jgi:tetratricopeptide (TPR) repeat protein
MRRFCLFFVLFCASFGLLVGAPKVSLAGPGPEKQAPPPVSDAATRAKIFNELFTRLREAPDPANAAQTRALITRIWAHSGSPTADLLMARAESALKGAQGAPAATLLDRIVSLYPDWSQGWRRRAQSALARGDNEGAMLDLNRALQAEPRDFLAMGELAELMRATNQDRPALELLRRALALDPRNEQLRAETEQLQRQVEGRDI